MTISAETINAMVQGQFPGSGSRCVEVGDNYAVATFVPDESNLRPGGFISGPTQFALFDAAFWYATFAAIDRIEPMALTSELSIRYLRPAVGERLHCRAQVESAGRRSVVLSGHIWCDDRADKPTSTAQGTYALPLTT